MRNTININRIIFLLILSCLGATQSRGADLSVGELHDKLGDLCAREFPFHGTPAFLAQLEEACSPPEATDATQTNIRDLVGGYCEFQRRHEVTVRDSLKRLPLTQALVRRCVGKHIREVVVAGVIERITAFFNSIYIRLYEAVQTYLANLLNRGKMIFEAEASVGSEITQKATDEAVACINEAFDAIPGLPPKEIIIHTPFYRQLVIVPPGGKKPLAEVKRVLADPDLAARCKARAAKVVTDYLATALPSSSPKNVGFFSKLLANFTETKTSVYLNTSPIERGITNLVDHVLEETCVKGSIGPVEIGREHFFERVVFLAPSQILQWEFKPIQMIVKFIIWLQVRYQIFEWLWGWVPKWVWVWAWQERMELRERPVYATYETCSLIAEKIKEQVIQRQLPQYIELRNNLSASIFANINGNLQGLYTAANGTAVQLIAYTDGQRTDASYLKVDLFDPYSLTRVPVYHSDLSVSPEEAQANIISTFVAHFRPALPGFPRRNISTVATFDGMESVFQFRPTDFSLVNYSNQTFQDTVVRRVWQFILKRDPDASVLGHWRFYFQDPRNFENLVSAHLSCDEYFIRNGNTSASFVGAIYRDILGRLPESQGTIDAWANVVNVHGRNAAIFGLLYSREFRNRFVSGLYKNFMRGRVATESEVSTGVARLDGGLTLSQAMREFIEAHRQEIQAIQ